jgi:hypothetical protein
MVMSSSSNLGPQATSDVPRLVKTSPLPHSDLELIEPSHAARDAVFETNELLHHILLQFLVKFRARARRVSRIWHNAISKIGFAADPVSKYDPFLSAFEYSIYSVHMDIRPHPLFDSNLIHPDIFQVRLRMSMYCDPDGTALESRRQEFITDPPITKITLGYGSRLALAVLRVRHGIRIGDLVDTMHKMPLEEPVERGVRRTFPSDPLIAWYDICKREPPLGIDFRGEGSPDGEEDCCYFHAEKSDKALRDAHDLLEGERTRVSGTADNPSDLQSGSGNDSDD